MNSIVLALVQQLMPVFMATLTRFTKKNPNTPVTVAGLTATLKAEGDVILAEGAAWVPNPNG